jgi:hypothetical protein
VHYCVLRPHLSPRPRPRPLACARRFTAPPALGKPAAGGSSDTDAPAAVAAAAAAAVAAAGGGTVTYFAGSSGYNDLYPLEYQVWAARTWQRGPCVRYARFRPTDFYAVSGRKR